MELALHYAESFFTALLPFLIGISFLVFIHELGHYVLARMNGIKVDVFSIGFGRELWGWNDRRGTRWKICALPLGGYVKMFGTEESFGQKRTIPLTPEERRVAFDGKTVLQRISVVLAGPVANFLLAITLFVMVGMVWGEKVRDPIIGSIEPNSPAERAGLLPHDRFITLDGKTIESYHQVVRLVRSNPNKTIQAEISRGLDQPTIIHIPLSLGSRTTDGKEHGFLGATASDKFHYNPLNLNESIENAWYITKDVLGVSLSIFWKMITGQESAAQNLSGPIGIAQMSGEALMRGPDTYIIFLGLISISLGLINLFPIPLLDGGHLLMLSIEGIIGRSLHPKIKHGLYGFGLVIILGLFILSSFVDIQRLL